MHNLVLTPISIEALTDKIALKTIEYFEKQKQPTLPNDSEELLSREDTCKFLQINSSTAWSWTNKGKIKAYGICGRVYYKKSELLEALTPLKK